MICIIFTETQTRKRVNTGGYAKQQHRSHKIPSMLVVVGLSSSAAVAA